MKRKLISNAVSSLQYEDYKRQSDLLEAYVIPFLEYLEFQIDRFPMTSQSVQKMGCACRLFRRMRHFFYT